MSRHNNERPSMEDIPDFAKTSFARSLFAQANDSQYNAIENVTGGSPNDDEDGHGIDGVPPAAAAAAAYDGGGGEARGSAAASIRGGGVTGVTHGYDPSMRSLDSSSRDNSRVSFDPGVEESPYRTLRKQPQSEFARRRTMQRSSIMEQIGADSSGIIGGGGGPPPPRTLERQESWMKDLQDQVQTEDLDPEAQAAANELLRSTTLSSAPDQYQQDSSNSTSLPIVGNATQEHHRAVALQQAAQQVRQNMGFDPEQRRASASKPPAAPTSTTAAASSPTGQPASFRSSTSSQSVAFKGPPPSEGRPLPPPSPSLPASLPPRPIASFRFFQHRKNDPRVPELCPGIDLQIDSDSSAAVFPTYDSSGNPLNLREELRKYGIGEEQIVVKCLTCRALLKVKKLASLVSCPRCSTVSPAISIIGSGAPQ